MSYYLNNREKIRVLPKECYQNNKDILKEKARNRHQNLSEEQKEIERQYSRNRYQKLIRKL